MAFHGRKSGVRPLLAALILGAVSGGFGQQVFTEVSSEMGISGQTGLGHAVGWCDIDNDGDLDVAFSNQDGSGLWLYRNDGSQFTDITASAGLSGLGAYRLLWADVTGNGYTDLILARGSNSRLFGNVDGTSFVDLTSGSGITGSPICVADFNNDGHTDILVLTGSGCSVLLNSGSGTFSELSAATGSWWSAAVIDYDMDGYPDIYLGTYGSDPNTLLRNNAGASFTDVTAEAGVEFEGSTNAITVGDYNNDGYSDLYLGNYSAPGCKLFRNNGDGTFTDVTAAAGVTGHTDTRTVAFGDYNNDGWLDIFVSHHDFYVVSNIMWRNNGDGTFSDVGSELGLSGEFMGDYFGVAWGDFNLDGDMDIFAVGHIDKYVLFRNDQSETIPSNYLVVELEGTISNPDAFGARVSAQMGSTTLTRWVGGGEGYHDFHMLPVHFGLYDAPSVETLTINWPSGLVETYTDISANQHIYAIEGDTLYTSVAGGSSDLPTRVMSLECGPNPFMESLSVEFSGAPGTAASVNIYDLGGRLLKSLGPVVLGGTVQTLLWDGRDGTGAEVPSGVYVFTLTGGGDTVIRRVTRLR